MKKKCSTNAISISTPVPNCPTVTPVVPVVPVGCSDPLTYFFKLVVDYSINQNIKFDLAVDNLLSVGLVFPKADIVCCPDCTNAPFYGLMNVARLNSLAGMLNWQSTEPNLITPCCINVEASVAKYNNYIQYMLNGDTPTKEIPDCCDNNFTSCLKVYADNLNYLALLNEGIVEINTLNGQSSLCNLYNLLDTYADQITLTSNVSNFILDFLMGGFVVHCCGCNIFIGTVDAFESYLNTNICLELNPY